MTVKTKNVVIASSVVLLAVLFFTIKNYVEAESDLLNNAVLTYARVSKEIEEKVRVGRGNNSQTVTTTIIEYSFKDANGKYYTGKEEGYAMEPINYTPLPIVYSPRNPSKSLILNSE